MKVQKGSSGSILEKILEYVGTNNKEEPISRKGFLRLAIRKFIQSISHNKVLVAGFLLMLLGLVGWINIFNSQIESVLVHIFYLTVAIAAILLGVIGLIRKKKRIAFIISMSLSMVVLLLLSSIFFLKANADEKKYLADHTNQLKYVQFAISDFIEEAKVGNPTYYEDLENKVSDCIKIDAPGSLKELDTHNDSVLKEIRETASDLQKAIISNDSPAKADAISKLTKQNDQLSEKILPKIRINFHNRFIQSSYNDIINEFMKYKSPRSQVRISKSVYITTVTGQMMTLYYGINDYLIETGNGDNSYYKSNLKVLIGSSKPSSSPYSELSGVISLINGHLDKVAAAAEKVDNGFTNNNQNEINAGRTALAELQASFNDQIKPQIQQETVKLYMIKEFEDVLNKYPDTFKSARTITREKAEADARAKAEAAAKAQAEAEAKAQAALREIQEFKDSCNNYSFSEISRSPSSYFGKRAYFRGEVVQVMETSLGVELRVNITQGSYGFWNDTIYVLFYNYDKNNRILEDDIIEMWGYLEGTHTYQTVLGASLTLPLFEAKYLEIE